jgi:D-glycero-alpha-D-manno-heptose-7-phosphate kinase
MVIAFSGQSRSSADIIEQQKSAMTSGSSQAIEALHSLKADAVEMKSLLLRGDVSGMGTILNRSWASKKATAAGITNPHIDALYELARRNGAIAGKVSGAGGGGFMMFVVPPEYRLDVVQALNGAGAMAGPVKFSDMGCESWQTRR